MQSLSGAFRRLFGATRELLGFLQIFGGLRRGSRGHVRSHTLQDTAPRPLLAPSWVPLGPPVGPSWGSLGALLGRLGCPWDSLGVD
eukprot:6558068-Pyramimonas_sp.AAC.2